MDNSINTKRLRVECIYGQGLVLWVMVAAAAAHHGLHELVRAGLSTTQGLRVCIDEILKSVSLLMVSP